MYVQVQGGAETGEHSLVLDGSGISVTLDRITPYHNYRFLSQHNRVHKPPYQPCMYCDNSSSKMHLRLRRCKYGKVQYPCDTCSPTTPTLSKSIGGNNLHPIPYPRLLSTGNSWESNNSNVVSSDDDSDVVVHTPPQSSSRPRMNNGIHSNSREGQNRCAFSVSKA